MTTIRILGLLVSLNIAAASAAELGGDLRVEQAYGTERGEHVMNRWELNLEAEAAIAGCDVDLRERLRHETRLGDQAYFDDDLRQASIECRRGDWLVSAGRQSVVWGKADAFVVLDAVHPFDYREFVVDTRESARRPLSMLRIERRLGPDSYLQWLIIPERRHDVLPAPADRFSAVWGVQSFLTQAAESTDQPDRWTWSRPQVGMKWEGASQTVGWTLNALERWASARYYRLTSDAGIVGTDYRQRLLGGSFDAQAGDSVVRAEVAHLSKVYLPRDGALDYRAYRQFNWMLGIDRNVGEWLMGVQFFQTRTVGDERPIAGRRHELLTLMGTRSALQDRLQVRGFMARDLNRSGSWASLQCTYLINPHFRFGVQADQFSGSTASGFGALEADSRVKLSVQADF